jgi:hypothetical protein
MLIVKLAMLYEGVFALKKMVTSTAFATRLGWSISPGMPWSVSPGMGGQLAPEWSGHIHQNLQAAKKRIFSFFQKISLSYNLGVSLPVIFVIIISKQWKIRKLFISPTVT